MREACQLYLRDRNGEELLTPGVVAALDTFAGAERLTPRSMPRTSRWPLSSRTGAARKDVHGRLVRALSGRIGNRQVSGGLRHLVALITAVPGFLCGSVATKKTSVDGRHDHKGDEYPASIAKATLKGIQHSPIFSRSFHPALLSATKKAAEKTGITVGCKIAMVATTVAERVTVATLHAEGRAKLPIRKFQKACYILK